MQSHGSILEDVIGVLPAADAGEAAEHPVGQRMEPVGDQFDDPIPRREVASGQLLQACRKKGRDSVVGIHTT